MQGFVVEDDIEQGAAGLCCVAAGVVLCSRRVETLRYNSPSLQDGTVGDVFLRGWAHLQYRFI